MNTSNPKMAQLCQYIEENTHQRLTLAKLSQEAGLSPQHLQRSFKAAIGISPRQYLEACRTRQLKQALKDGLPSSDAIYQAGFSSSSRVYERSQLGMTPAQYQKHGAGLEISYATSNTPLGLLMIAATDRGVCFVQFGANDLELLAQLKGEFSKAKLIPSPAEEPQLALWISALLAYLQGTSKTLQLPLDLAGTPFQLKVWHYLQTIPYGSVQTYSKVATAIDHPTAIRAAASACAANRIALLIPCHRVLRGDGGLGGYRWGLERKEALLALEGKC
jgi:AraC family transcriptional regulator, regulatory protein of adaptative response / methylated-DNA-[protein]-cysteine methyltransferase